VSEEQNIPQQELTPVQRIRSDWKSLLGKVSYKGIVNNIPYLAFLALLIIVYINNSQHAVAVQRETNKKADTLKVLRWKYMDIKSNLISAGMEGEVMRTASALGLKPLVLPAYKITVDSNNKPIVTTQ
jgi:hypothetical protein